MFSATRSLRQVEFSWSQRAPASSVSAGHASKRLILREFAAPLPYRLSGM